jgi:hypothetical protein
MSTASTGINVIYARPKKLLKKVMAMRNENAAFCRINVSPSRMSWAALPRPFLVIRETRRPYVIVAMVKNPRPAK